MKYVPNLIPKEARVLPDYFKESNEPVITHPSAFQLIEYVIGAILLIMAFASLPHIFSALLLGWMAVIVSPLGQEQLERGLQFKMTGKIKLGICVLLSLIQVPLFTHYRTQDVENERLAIVEKARIEQVKRDEDKKEHDRLDSLDYYIHAADIQDGERDLTKALSTLQYARSFTKEVSEMNDIGRRQDVIVIRQVALSMDSGNYSSALEHISPLLAEHPDNADLWYQRAVCYSKLSNKPEAVSSARMSMNLGNSLGKRLYDQLNPIKRRVLYYQTMCCDGSPSPSNAKGRGACSHHGGVCDWNSPVYEEYRQYE